MDRPQAAVSMLMLTVAVLGCNYFDHRAGNGIVAKIETFKKSTGHLPEALSDIGLKENDSCPYYCKTSNDSYIVWYGTTLGESDTFDSRTQRWSEVNIACSR